MSKIKVSQAKFNEALALYGMDTYDHLVIEGACVHHWKLHTASGVNGLGTFCYAFAYEECENCGDKRNKINLLG